MYDAAIRRRVCRPGDESADVADPRRDCPVGTRRERSRREDGPPNYTYVAVPGVPSVTAMRLGPEALEHVLGGPHSHDYLVLDYFERDGGSLRLGQREWLIEAGDVY